MNLSEKGRKFIQKHEGFSQKWYDLGDGGLTVGWGHYLTHATAKAKGIKVGQLATIQQCEAYFDYDMKRFVDGTNKMLTRYKFKVNQSQFDALVSYAYNRGLGNSYGTNGLHQLLKNSKNIKELHSNFIVYWGTAVKFKKGLLNRRKAEQTLFASEGVFDTTKTQEKIGYVTKSKGAVITLTDVAIYKHVSLHEIYKVRVYPKGTKFNYSKVDYYGQLPRLYTNSGYFITANKLYVKEV